jgi:predicted ribosome quality control (RQC) complex YloA/Tae2 family protein
VNSSLLKREFTSFDVAAVVRELKNSILNSRVSNIYQLNSKKLLFKLRTGDGNIYRLIMEAGRRLHLTTYAMEKPSTPPSFCMALRKYLRNAFLTGIEQYEFERIVIFRFKGKRGLFKLVLELFGDGNVLLVEEKGEILQALIYKRMRDRNILRGEIFRFPPSSGKNPFEVSLEGFREDLREFGNVEVVRGLARFLSIGGLYAEEILLRASLDKTKPCSTLSLEEIDKLFEHLQDLLRQVKDGKLEPCIVVDDNGIFLDAIPIKLKRYQNFKFKPYPRFNEALDEFFVRTEVLEKTRSIAGAKVEELKQEANRLRRIIEAQNKALIEAKAVAERYRKIGDAIYAHAGNLQLLLNRFIEGKKSGREWKHIVSEVLNEKKMGINPSIFFDFFDDRRLKISVCVDGLRFGLNLRKKLFDIAGRFYERSKRAKQKMEGAKNALEATKRQLEEIETKIRENEALIRVKPEETVEEIAKRKIKPKKWFEKFRWFISSDGFLVVAGKDAVSNEVLIKKYTEPNDIVFHADLVGAPFVVVKTKGKKPSKQCLQEAGEFAAVFSRGWREGFASVDVYWVKPEQLSKGGISGEYVPKGAFLVRGRRNWMRGTPLKIAIGVKETNGKIEFINGPVGAVESKTRACIILVPGQQRGKLLFKQVLKVLAAKMSKEVREKIEKMSLEKIREYIPYANGRILEK